MSISVYYINNIRYDLNHASFLNSKIIQLGFLNKEMDLIFSQEMNYINYDTLANRVIQADEIFKEISLNARFQSILDSRATKSLYIKIEKGFNKKTEFINDFASNNAVLNNSLRFLSPLLTKILQDKESKSNEALMKFHSKLLQLGLGLDVRAEDLQKEAKSRIHPKTDRPTLLLYAKHANLVLEYYQRLEEVKAENIAINLEKTISNLTNQINIYKEALYNRLYQILGFLFIFSIIAVIIIYNIITKSDKSTHRLRAFQQAIRNSDNSVVLTDKDNKILYVNEKFKKLFGYTEEEVISKTPKIISSGAHDKEFFEEFHKTISSGQTWTGEFINKRKDGKLVFVKASVAPIFDDKKSITGYVGIELDISDEKSRIREMEEKNRELERLSYEDEITRLGSQRALMDRIYKNEPGTIVYINIDHFSDIRFFYGISLSNRILVALSQTLKLFAQTHQIEADLYRIQSDEFCIWFNEDNFDNKNLEYLKDYVRNHPYEIEGTSQDISITIGVSSNEDIENADRLMQSVLAHHEAKMREIPLAFYDKTSNLIEEQYQIRMSMTRVIKYALANDKVTAHCQGIYNAKTKEVEIYEILIRIIDETGKIRYPGEFLEIAKKTSLYNALTHQMIKLTFELMEKYPNMKFSMNMSSMDMLNLATKKWFEKHLKDCTNPKNLTVEILESEGIDDYDLIVPFISKIKQQGCKLAIDDFGSGYSNYYRMLQLDIDYLKIDGSIIKALPYDENARSVVKTIIDFANHQGYGVVAEFVSDERILQATQEYGIELVQGFYLGKPKNIDEL